MSLTRCISLLFFCLFSTPSFAAALQVTPVRVSLRPDHRIATLVLENQSKESVDVQLQVRRWEQQEGKDHFTPTQAILIVPPITTLKAKSTQIIRLAQREAMSGQIEQSYRLFIRELPHPHHEQYQGLQLALQISLPIFVLPSQGGMSHLNWRIEKRYSDGRVKLSVQNTGQAHALISHLKLSDVDKTALIDEKVFNYVLAGHRTDWILKPKHPQQLTKYHLTATTETGDIDSDVG